MRYTKEQMWEAFKAGWNMSGEGFNAEFSMHGEPKLRSRFHNLLKSKKMQAED